MLILITIDFYLIYELLSNDDIWILLYKATESKIATIGTKVQASSCLVLGKGGFKFLHLREF